MYWAHKYKSLNNLKKDLFSFIQMDSVDEFSIFVTPLAILLRILIIIPPEFLRVFHFFLRSLRKFIYPFILGQLSSGPSHDSRIRNIICIISGQRHFNLAFPPILRHPIFKLYCFDIYETMINNKKINTRKHYIIMKSVMSRLRYDNTYMSQWYIVSSVTKYSR